jgi:hypothetical protein
MLKVMGCANDLFLLCEQTNNIQKLISRLGHPVQTTKTSSVVHCDSSPLSEVPQPSAPPTAISQCTIAPAPRRNHDSKGLNVNVNALLISVRNRHYKTIQKMCATQGGFEFARLNEAYKINPKDWWLCYTTGIGCQDKMVDNITALFQKNKREADPVNYDNINGDEFVELMEYVDTLCVRHRKTIHKLCYDNGSTDPIFAKYSGVEWKKCLVEGDGCRDAMIANIRKMFREALDRGTLVRTLDSEMD